MPVVLLTVPWGISPVVLRSSTGTLAALGFASPTPLNPANPYPIAPAVKALPIFPPFNKLVMPPANPALVAKLNPASPAPPNSRPDGPMKYASAAASAIWPIELLPTSWMAFDMPLKALLKISDMEVLQE